MKKIIYSSFIAILLIAAGCTDDLKLTPISSKSVQSFYKTPDDLEQAMVGCYCGLRAAEMQDYFSYMMTESRSDNAWQQVDYDDGAFSRFTETASTPTINSAWSRLYNTILRCNYVITSISNVTFDDEDQKNKLEGEAKFIRALMYFDLVRYFGGVPIVEKPLTISESYKLERASIEDVYNFIISDLTAAIELLPDVLPSETPNRATVTAAHGFLGKVYVFRSGYPLNIDSWQEAKTELEAVLNKVGSEGFFANYEDIFLYENENKAQSIFSLGFKSSSSGQGNPYPTRNAPNGIKPGDTELTVRYGGSPWRLFFDESILQSIFPEEGDKRRTYSIQEQWEEKSGMIITNEPFCKKYQNGPVGGGSDWDIDWILLRYTDVYMLYAEALYHTGDKSGALKIINDVRNRAGISTLTLSDISTDADFTNVIQRERRSEFCFENQRWFDLIRSDLALDVMKAFLDNYGISANLQSRDQYFYPIPQRETDITGLK